jgi:hypothetical protein
MRRTEDDPARTPAAADDDTRKNMPNSSVAPRFGRDPIKSELVVGALGVFLGVVGQLLHSSASLYVGATFAAIGFGMLWFRAMYGIGARAHPPRPMTSKSRALPARPSAAAVDHDSTLVAELVQHEPDRRRADAR